MSRTLFYDGNILTMETEHIQEAIMINNGIIERTGTLEEMYAFADNRTERIRLYGNTLMPGFIDSHSHFLSFAYQMLEPDLSGATDLSTIKNKILHFYSQQKPESPGWLTAGGLPDGLPRFTLRDLDTICGQNPLVIKTQSGHMGYINSAGLRLLQISDRCNGYLEETDFLSALKRIPAKPLNQINEAVKEAQKIYLSYGITTMQEGMILHEMVPMIESICQKELLDIDWVGYADASNAAMIYKKLEKYSGTYVSHFRLGGRKTFLDGSPQGRTAWMKSPYIGTRNYCGYGTMTDDELYEIYRTALHENKQLLLHCNGDAAIEQAIRVYERALANFHLQYTALGTVLTNITDIRPVLVHCQFAGRKQLKRAKQLGMIPSFFMEHVYEFGDCHCKNLGEKRAASMSPARTAATYDLNFTMHQDTPVLRPDMFHTLWCACVRKTRSGRTLGPDERISVFEALKALTINGAYQYFEESVKGTLSPGKYADMILVDKNPLTVPVDELPDIKILEVYKKGKPLL